jgi:hypothetical protein
MQQATSRQAKKGERKTATGNKQQAGKPRGNARCLFLSSFRAFALFCLNCDLFDLND